MATDRHGEWPLYPPAEQDEAAWLADQMARPILDFECAVTGGEPPPDAGCPSCACGQSCACEGPCDDCGTDAPPRKELDGRD